MLKISSRRRRTQAEIKAQKLAEANKEADLEEKLSKSRSLRVNIDAYSGRTGQRIL
mgnify:CR=1 FL=1